METVASLPHFPDMTSAGPHRAQIRPTTPGRVDYRGDEACFVPQDAERSLAMEHMREAVLGSRFGSKRHSRRAVIFCCDEDKTADVTEEEREAAEGERRGEEMAHHRLEVLGARPGTPLRYHNVDLHVEVPRVSRVTAPVSGSGSGPMRPREIFPADVYLPGTGTRSGPMRPRETFPADVYLPGTGSGPMRPREIFPADVDRVEEEAPVGPRRRSLDSGLHRAGCSVTPNFASPQQSRRAAAAQPAEATEGAAEPCDSEEQMDEARNKGHGAEAAESEQASWRLRMATRSVPRTLESEGAASPMLLLLKRAQSAQPQKAGFHSELEIQAALGSGHLVPKWSRICEQLGSWGVMKTKKTSRAVCPGLGARMPFDMPSSQYYA